MEARLILEDGSVFKGTSRGARGEAWGEVVFNTSMTGYQEIMTDPSSCGHILTMTFPLLGNCGINKEDSEARRPFLRGFLARELCSLPHSWRSLMTIEDYLREQQIVAMDGLDTRALTRLLREKGSMRGLLTTEKTPQEALVKKVRGLPALSELDLISEVTTPEVYSWKNKGPHMVVLDLGLRLSLVQALYEMGNSVTVVPASCSAGDLMEFKPDGLVISGGPGDPRRAKKPLRTVQKLLGKIPMLGICLGHQVIALALGGKTEKLQFGHRGANYPVKDLARNKVYITSQNHGFIVSKEGLPPGLEVTQINLNDETIEGLREKKLGITSLQYYPETFPNFWGRQPAVALFLEDIRSHK